MSATAKTENTNAAGSPSPAAVVVRSSQLGLNCWDARRFTGGRWKCNRYRVCKYPERVACKDYDEARAKISETTLTLRQLYRDHAREWPEAEGKTTTREVEVIAAGEWQTVAGRRNLNPNTEQGEKC